MTNFQKLPCIYLSATLNTWTWRHAETVYLYSGEFLVNVGKQFLLLPKRGAHYDTT